MEKLRKGTKKFACIVIFCNFAENKEQAYEQYEISDRHTEL